jgi:hypothetical protein
MILDEDRRAVERERRFRKRGELQLGPIQEPTGRKSGRFHFGSRTGAKARPWRLTARVARARCETHHRRLVTRKLDREMACAERCLDRRAVHEHLACGTDVLLTLRARSAAKGDVDHDRAAGGETLEDESPLDPRAPRHVRIRRVSQRLDCTRLDCTRLDFTRLDRTRLEPARKPLRHAEDARIFPILVGPERDRVERVLDVQRARRRTSKRLHGLRHERARLARIAQQRERARRVGPRFGRRVDLAPKFPSRFDGGAISESRATRRVRTRASDARRRDAEQKPAPPRHGRREPEPSRITREARNCDRHRAERSTKRADAGEVRAVLSVRAGGNCDHVRRNAQRTAVSSSVNQWSREI